MSQHTTIEWCDSTVNPTMGCDGCELWSATNRTCYAGQMTARYAGKKGFPKSFDVIEQFPGRMAKAAAWGDLAGTDRADKPWLNGMPRVIFISDMSDALSAAIPFEYLKHEIIENVASKAGKRHIWMWLTKRPSRMAEFARWLGSWPANLWAGTSLTTDGNLSRVGQLLGVPAKVRFLSCEPLLGPLNLQKACTAVCPNKGQCHSQGNDRIIQDSESGGIWVECACSRLNGIHLVIAGGESGKGARPCHPDWARLLRDQCQAAGVSFFWKQWGEYRPCELGCDCPGHQFEGQPTTHHWYPGGPVASYRPGTHARVVLDSKTDAIRLGKHNAGRLLDGREWNGFPKAVLS